MHEGTRILVEGSGKKSGNVETWGPTLRAVGREVGTRGLKRAFFACPWVHKASRRLLSPTHSTESTPQKQRGSFLSFSGLTCPPPHSHSKQQLLTRRELEATSQEHSRGHESTATRLTPHREFCTNSGNIAATTSAHSRRKSSQQTHTNTCTRNHDKKTYRNISHTTTRTNTYSCARTRGRTENKLQTHGTLVKEFRKKSVTTFLLPIPVSDTAVPSVLLTSARRERKRGKTEQQLALQPVHRTLTVSN